MTAFAGFFSFKDGIDPGLACGAMSSHATRRDLVGDGPVSFAHIPDFDGFAGTAVVPEANLRMAGDARLHNRAEIASRVKPHSSSLANMSDLQLLLRAWQNDGPACLDYVRGDFAFALFDGRSRRLWLVRAPMSGCQLFYNQRHEGIGFASDLHMLLRMPGLDRELDLSSAARFASGIPFPDSTTMYRGVSRLNHSTMLEIDDDGHSRATVFWSPRRVRPSGVESRDYAERFATSFETAVGRRLSKGTGGVASELSSGRDSGAVTVVAAELLQAQGLSLDAFTAAPESGFSRLAPYGRISDESGVADSVAALHPNIRHHVLRPNGDPFDLLDTAHALLPNPIGHLSNFPWSRDIVQGARDAGAHVLLNGAVGNFTVSAGGRAALLPLLREEGALRWLRAALASATGPRDFARLMHSTFGGLVPRSGYNWLIRLVSARPSQAMGLDLLRPKYRASVQQLAEAELEDRRPPANWFELRREMLMAQDPTNAFGRSHGVDTRDPTADRDFIETCFAAPPELLVGRGHANPLYDRVFAAKLGRQPGDVRPRGYQAADWYNQFTRARVRSAYHECRNHPAVMELLEVDRLDRLIEEWPTRWDDWWQEIFYRNTVLGAVGLAHFVKTNF
ncbi:hypothetical protein H8M03_03400 [Sphingomonas sabuli]|uniref:asparagine synthase (glutamine-hydrolyzing) n=1 Tax=Sphingomonas sabuli TaxID=2764186 RepID=A0A7G9L451_9SPHN|nr:asparagine synthase-related protein [Sphingomonas sabuli]QNM83400.1 hypothetical protein H8M03_03400 [Sphingomonas sabuli]